MTVMTPLQANVFLLLLMISQITASSFECGGFTTITTSGLGARCTMTATELNKFFNVSWIRCSYHHGGDLLGVEVEHCGEVGALFEGPPAYVRGINCSFGSIGIRGHNGRADLGTLTQSRASCESAAEELNLLVSSGTLKLPAISEEEAAQRTRIFYAVMGLVLSAFLLVGLMTTQYFSHDRTFIVLMTFKMFSAFTAWSQYFIALVSWKFILAAPSTNACALFQYCALTACILRTIFLGLEWPFHNWLSKYLGKSIASGRSVQTIKIDDYWNILRTYKDQSKKHSDYTYAEHHVRAEQEVEKQYAKELGKMRKTIEKREKNMQKKQKKKNGPSKGDIHAYTLAHNKLVSELEQFYRNSRGWLHKSEKGYKAARVKDAEKEWRESAKRNLGWKSLIIVFNVVFVQSPQIILSNVAVSWIAAAGDERIDPETAFIVQDDINCRLWSKLVRVYNLKILLF